MLFETLLVKKLQLVLEIVFAAMCSDGTGGLNTLECSLCSTSYTEKSLLIVTLLCKFVQSCVLVIIFSGPAPLRVLCKTRQRLANTAITP